jgi:two-component system NtrC family sensor kinase
VTILKDSGFGIQSDAAVKLFTPFFTTKEVGKGTLLGLSISKEIINEHGGELEYAPAENTTFKLTLPLIKG